MTLEEYRKAKHEDFFLAVISKKIGWEQAHEVVVYLPQYPEGITVLELMETSVEIALAENKVPITEENKKIIEKEVKETFSTFLEEWYPVILLKYGESYIDLSEMKELGKEYEIKCLVPMKEYYKEDEYSFEEDEGGIYINIEPYPFSCFATDYEEGKFN